MKTLYIDHGHTVVNYYPKHSVVIGFEDSKKRNRAKMFANQLLSDVFNALASVLLAAIHCWLPPEEKKKLRWSFVNCFSLRKAVKTYDKV